MKRRNMVQEDSGYDILGLSRWMALRYLNKWTKYLNDKCTGNPFSLTDHIPIGFGNTQGEKCVEVGIGGLSADRHPFSHVPDYNFMLAGVALFHERQHRVQVQNQKEHVPELQAQLSVYGNLEYYLTGWQEFPHEVDAEYNGVMDMWDAMDAAFPEKADECMVAFLRRRAKTTSYMLQPSDCKFDVPVWPGYGSDADFQAARGRLRESVTNAFEAAYVASLDMPRHPQGAFRRYSDDVSRLLCENRRTRPEYVSFFKRLIDSVPGTKKDRMMASLVLYMRPGLSDRYIAEVVSGLTPEETFGISMPETPDEIRERLGITDAEGQGSMTVRDRSRSSEIQSLLLGVYGLDSRPDGPGRQLGDD